jgi:hypothetical protein
VHSIHRQRLQSKVLAEKMIIAVQSLLSLIFELKVAYALYDIPSLTDQKEESERELTQQIDASSNYLENLKFKVGNCLERIETFRSLRNERTRI